MAKKNNNGGPQTRDENNDDNNKRGDMNIVMRIHLHCPGCMTRIRKLITRFPGVCTVDFEGEDLVMVKVLPTAIVEPQKLKEKVEKKTGKCVQIISPQPKKDKDNKNPPKQSDKPKEVQVKTVMLKLSWHCYGCGIRIHRAISSFPGVYELSIDKEKDQVKVTGKMDPNKLVSELQKKLKRTVEILPEKKEKEKEAKKEEKKKENGGGGGAKENGGGGIRIDNNMWFTGVGYWSVEPGSDPVYVYAPPLFSDENPNACSLM